MKQYKGKRRDFTDYSRCDKINVGHNLSEAFDFHDIVRTMIVRMLRRRYPDKRRAPIYTEYNPIAPNDNYPDIWIRIYNSSIYVYELQDKITEKWTEKKKKQHENVTLIIVDLNKLKKEWIDLRFRHKHLERTLAYLLEKYII